MACDLCNAMSVTKKFCIGCGERNNNFNLKVYISITQGKGLAFAAADKDCEDGHPESGSSQVAELFGEEYQHCSGCGLKV